MQASQECDLLALLALRQVTAMWTHREEHMVPENIETAGEYCHHRTHRWIIRRRL